MQRFFLTCAIGMGLMAALQLYAHVMTPLTRPVVQPRQPPPMTPPNQTPMSVSVVAQAWLPEEEWLKSVAICWQRSEQSYLFAQTVEADETRITEGGGASPGDTIRMKPFAMIWKNSLRPDDPPLTVVSESARVRFENRFFDENSFEDNSLNLSGGNSGRIVSAALEGQVRITGPDGLVVDGENFVFTEETMPPQLYSDHAVNFWYGPSQTGKPVQVRGTSAVGLLIEFTPVTTSPFGPDMPRVAQIPKSAQLRGRVAIDFITEDNGQPRKTRVTSEGPFKFDFEKNTATFTENVLVNRPCGQSHKDEIECQLLALIFGEPQQARDSQARDVIQVRSEDLPGSDPLETEPSGLISRLELKYIRALSTQSPHSVTKEPVILRSTENGLECELADLQYDAISKLFRLIDPERVTVWREHDGQLQKFEAPQIEIRHTDDQKLQQISGVGAGQFSHRENATSKGVPELWGRWKDRMDLLPNPQEESTVLTLRGSATVGQLDQLQFSGQTLTAWLPPLEELEAGLGQRQAGAKPAANRVNPDQLPIHRIQAIGNVTFVAPGVIGRRIDQVDIQMSPGQIIPLQTPQRQPETDAESGEAQPVRLEEPLVFECARIHGTAVFDAAVQRVDIRELHGIEGVQVFRAAADSDGAEQQFEQQPVRVTAREFDAVNTGGARQILTLRGVVDDKGNIREPVIAKFGDFSIEGPKIVIDREQNLVTVDGQSVLRFPVQRDFSGNPLNPPAIADIACVEQITFDGKRATFLQSVKATLLDNLIRAEEMTAVLNQRIDFSEERPETKGVAIQTMECRDKVSIEMYQYGPQNQLVEILRAQLHQFEINQLSGKFQGQGPGKIEDWRRTGTRRMLVQSQGSAQSNRPADAHREYPWEYVGIDFKGQLEGHTQDRWGQLNDRVELLYAPVKNANQIFKRNDLSGDDQNAGHAVWVGSQQMTISISGDQAAKQPTVAIEALENAEMEGRNFYARAYSLQYEQAKEMFTLRGKGRDKATLNVQRNAGEAFSKLPAQVIHIFPSKKEVSVDGAKTFTTAFGGP